MKKLLTASLMLMVLTVMVPVFSSTVSAQTRYYGSERRYTSGYKKPSIYRRHRNLINIAIGTGGGALLGGLFGGKKGALIGAAAGAGGSALYTYKLKPKKRRYHADYYQRY